MGIHIDSKVLATLSVASVTLLPESRVADMGEGVQTDAFILGAPIPLREFINRDRQRVWNALIQQPKTFSLLDDKWKRPEIVCEAARKEPLLFYEMEVDGFRSVGPIWVRMPRLTDADNYKQCYEFYGKRQQQR